MKHLLNKERESVSEDRIDQASDLRLRDGKPEDAEELFSLIRTAFGDRLLQYSIYQSSGSVAYLRIQLDKEIFRIAACEGVPVGYYHAHKTESTFHTKYLAAVRQRSCGIVAPALVRDAIRMACLMQCSALECEVPAWNKRLIALYHRYGANQVGTSYIYRVDLSRVPKKLGLSISPLELRGGLTQEKQQGFSKITARWESSEVVIGLLNEDACKILDGGGLSVMDIAGLISSSFPTRNHLLVTSTRLPDEYVPLAGLEELARLGGDPRVALKALSKLTEEGGSNSFRFPDV